MESSCHVVSTTRNHLLHTSTVIGQCSQLEAVRVIGTDGEKALIDAFKHEFGFAQHLTCFIHVRRNIKNKLHERNIPSQLSIEILDDIFGKTVGATHVEGLQWNRFRGKTGKMLPYLVQQILMAFFLGLQQNQLSLKTQCWQQ